MKYTKPVNIRLEKKTHLQLKKYAKEHNMEVSSAIRMLIKMIVEPAKKGTA